MIAGDLTFTSSACDGTKSKSSTLLVPPPRDTCRSQYCPGFRCLESNTPDLGLLVLPHVQEPPESLFPAPRDESSPAQLQEMESSTDAGVTAAPTAKLPPNPYLDAVVSDAVTSLPLKVDPMAGLAAPPDLLQTPDPSRYIDHLQSSNVRGSPGEQIDPNGPAPDSADRDAATILANGTLALANGDHPPSQDDSNAPAAFLQQLALDSIPHGLGTERDVREPFPQETAAFAKLVFPDGDFFITTHDVMLGRNMDYFKQIKRKKRSERRAQEAMDSYRLEPSQPSQQSDGDHQGDRSNSSPSLEGRPAPPSNVSEHGGVVSYEALSGDEADAPRKRRRNRRSLAVSKSSSTTSIDPSRIHTSIMSDKSTALGPDGEPEERTHAFIPIHPQKAADIKNISREHLKFSFNFAKAQWELHILNNRAFVNDDIHDKGDIVELHHNDEVMVASVHVTFKLPDNFRDSPGISHGTFSTNDDELSYDDDDEEEDDDNDQVAPTSPARRLSRTVAAASSDADDDEINEPDARPKLKIKAKPTPSEPKKKKLKNESTNEASPEATKKGKKPKTADKSVAEPKKEENASSLPAHNFELDSTLAKVPVGELPPKRKGPGRPPKNGLISKRDQALVAKKQKEYEKRGDAVPTYDALVAEVRLETKEKERLQKGVSNGDPAPGTTVVQSIETEPTHTTAESAAGSKAQTTGQADASAEPARKASPTKAQKRKERTPSPVPPEESFTEEQLKKPNGTYVHIIDQILREHPDGGADLPDIYLRIQKKYPHFRYRVPTLGWQSSVRHNLLQHARFIERGKSGKGKVWTIDYSVSIDKEQKKRRATPPPMRTQTMQNGQSMQQPGQYGQAQYGNPYGNAQPNGQPHFSNANQRGSAAYLSPYGQPGPSGQYPGQHPQAGPSNMSAQASNGVAQKSRWELMIEEFIKLGSRYNTMFEKESDEVKKQRDVFWNTSLTTLSDAFMTHTVASTVLPPPTDERDVWMQTQLKEMFLNQQLVAAAEENAKKRVDNGAAVMTPESAQPSGAVAAVESTQGGPDSAAQTGVPAPTPAVGTAPQPHINGDGVGAGSGEAAVNPAPPKDSPQRSPETTEKKRAMEEADEEPEAKRHKRESV